MYKKKYCKSCSIMLCLNYKWYFYNDNVFCSKLCRNYYYNKNIKL